MKEIAPFMECFGIDISIQDSKPLIDSKKRTILRLNAGSRFALDNPVRIDADPFLFVHNGTLFLFYEDNMIRKISNISLIFLLIVLFITPIYAASGEYY